MSVAVDITIRPDLHAAHQQAWEAIGRPGTWWTGRQRVELAGTALAAMTEDDPLPPWIAPSSVDGRLPADATAPVTAHDAIHRIAAHAGTLTEAWYGQMSDALGDLPYVEIVGIACTVAAVVAFRRAAGLEPWTLPAPVDGEPSGEVPAVLVPTDLNWVRVTPAPAPRAAVVQAFTSVPAEDARLWTLAAAQYIPNLEMVDPRWTRGTLTRPQIEVVATRVAQLRECFY